MKTKTTATQTHKYISFDEFSYTTEIFGLEVRICGEKVWGNAFDIEFSIDGNYSRMELSKIEKIRITRWLLQCWEEIKTLPNFQASCNPCIDEGAEDPLWRSKYYERLGFRPGFSQTGLQNDYTVMYYN